MSECDGFFRSEEMTLIQLYIPFESGHECMTRLGETGLVEFRDVSFKSVFFKFILDFIFYIYIFYYRIVF